MRISNAGGSAETTVKANFKSGCLLLAACLFVWGVYPVVAQNSSALSDTASLDQKKSGANLNATKPTGQQVSSPELDQSATSTSPALPDSQPTEEKRERRGSIVIAPIPISSPALGSGVVPVAAYIFRLSRTDKVSPPSVIGAAGFFTSNGSRAFALGAQLYLQENLYKLTAGYVHGNINYDLYGSREFTGLKLPLKQNGQGFLAQFQRRIGWGFFLGPQFLTGRSTLSLRESSTPTFPAPPDIGVDATLTAIGVLLTRDTSSNRFYPTDGSYFNFTSTFFSESLGSKYSFQSYRVSVAKYWGVTQNQVLAYNAYFCGTGGQPPFYGNCIYGNSNQLRGYVPGKYFDKYMVTTQLEYRVALPWRLGLVAFGGVGDAIPGGNHLLFRDNNFLPSGGGGLRFVLSKQYHLNLRADIARGKDGHTFSLGIGEAF